FSVLSLDSGNLISDHTHSNLETNTAALTVAFTYVADPKMSQPATAEAHARATAVKNTVGGVTIAPAQVDVCVGDDSSGTCSPDPSLKRVKVTITRQEPTFLARIWRSSVTTRVEATAEASSAPTSALCLKPFFIPNTAFAPGSVTTNSCT